MHENNIWFLSGMAVAITAVIIAWWTVADKWPDDIQVSSPGELATSQTGGSAGLPVHASEIDKLREGIDYLNKRLKMLTDSATYLEGKLIRAHVITDSIINTENILASATPQKQYVIPATGHEVERFPPPAAGITDAKAIESSSSDKPAGVAASKPMAADRKTGLDTAKDTGTREPVRLAAKQPAAIAGKMHESEEQHPAKTIKTGPWVINLVSSPNKADADRLAEKARSRDIQTEQQQVTVRGTQYWRVQITGFSTADDARAYADTAKGRLGLKDVWIMKH
ncbi:MAG: SPOR domain-containing protein [Pseudomonadota bacterium]